MAIRGISALGASAASEISGAPPISTPAASASTPGLSFTQTLGQVVGDAIGTLQSGEAAAIQGVQGALPPLKVVESILSAQRTLQQALSIRDKAVTAYQEISRMSI
jgi:flagellar hook-basal body complex protein FliE